MPPGSKIRCLRVCLSARLVRPLCEWQKARGPRVSKVHTKQSFPSFATRPAASAFLSRDSKWRKLEERLHGSLTANRSTARRPKILYAIEADLLVAYAGVRPVVRRVTWLRIAPNSLSGKSNTSIIHNKSRPSFPNRSSMRHLSAHQNLIVAIWTSKLKEHQHHLPSILYTSYIHHNGRQDLSVRFEEVERTAKTESTRFIQRSTRPGRVFKTSERIISSRKRCLTSDITRSQKSNGLIAITWIWATYQLGRLQSEA